MFVRLSSIGQLDSFKNYSSFIGKSEKKLFKKQAHNKCEYERTVNKIP